jgi:hypothetical protein
MPCCYLRQYLQHFEYTSKQQLDAIRRIHSSKMLPMESIADSDKIALQERDKYLRKRQKRYRKADRRII